VGFEAGAKKGVNVNSGQSAAKITDARWRKNLWALCRWHRTERCIRNGAVMAANNENCAQHAGVIGIMASDGGQHKSLGGRAQHGEPVALSRMNQSENGAEGRKTKIYGMSYVAEELLGGAAKSGEASKGKRHLPAWKTRSKQAAGASKSYAGDPAVRAADIRAKKKKAAACSMSRVML